MCQYWEHEDEWGGKIGCFWWASHSGWGNRTQQPIPGVVGRCYGNGTHTLPSLCSGTVGPLPKADISTGHGKEYLISAVSKREARHSRQQEQHAKTWKHKREACSGNWGCPGHWALQGERGGNEAGKFGSSWTVRAWKALPCLNFIPLSLGGV